MPFATLRRSKEGKGAAGEAKEEPEFAIYHLITFLTFSWVTSKKPNRNLPRSSIHSPVAVMMRVRPAMKGTASNTIVHFLPSSLVNRAQGIWYLVLGS